MAQQGITFEWVLEETRVEVWNGLSGTTTGHQRDNADRLVGTYVMRGLALLLAALLAAGAAGLSPHEKARREAHSGITFHLLLENQAWRNRDYVQMTALLDPTVSDEWQRQWRDYWRRGNDGDPSYRAKLVQVEPAGDGLFRATVVVEQSALEWWQSSPYQEERFYRREGQHWVRTIPPADYWGTLQVIETEHLRFSFYEQDAAIVAAVAPRLQAAYVALHAALDVPAPSAAAEKLAVHVMPRPVGRWASGQNRLEVTSPAVLQLSVGERPEDALAADVMSWFTYRVLRDSTPAATGRYLHRWPIVIWGLRGWLSHDLLQSSSPWRAEAMEVLRNSDALPFGLANVTHLRGDSRPSREEVIVRYLAAESFIAYAMETYGRERLADFLAALMRFGDWNRIIPEVYGVSAEKFVADWNVFVLTRYIGQAAQ